jgi:hypothetical protein
MWGMVSGFALALTESLCPFGTVLRRGFSRHEKMTPILNRINLQSL